MLKNADIITDIVTPFDCRSQINFDVLKHLTDRLFAEGGTGFLIGGITGENKTLSYQEKLDLYQKFTEIVASKAAIIAWTGNNSTQATIQFTQAVANINGINAVMVVVPNLNQQNQTRIKKHFQAVADSTTLPIIIDNVTNLAGESMQLDTILELSHHPNIIGIKQYGPLEMLEKIIDQTTSDFLVYTGMENQALAIKKLDGQGVISVSSHLYMKDLRHMYQVMNNNMQLAKQIQQALTPKMQAILKFPATSAVKFLLNRDWINVGNCRLAINNLSEAEQNELLAVVNESNATDA